MCGIVGLLTRGKVEEAVLNRMVQPIVHRGPDAGAVWTDPKAGVGLGFRRLAIIDLSPAGMQPMSSADGRYVIVFNGEIYNHLELRAELDASGGGPRAAGAAWRGHSDTETLVEGIAHWGLEETLRRAVGMFGIAVWDKKDRTLGLARDRFGEKPLYYGWVGGDFVFASELKSLAAHPKFNNEIDRESVRLMLARTNVPAPLSIVRGVFKLEPGCMLTASFDAALEPHSRPILADTSSGGISVKRYWSYRDVIAQGLAAPITDEREALVQLEAALAVSIRGQSVAEVPVGAFLSGGIDSSAIVALYQKYSNSRVRTFTIGFNEAEFNEAHYAKAVAQHLGTDHNELYVTVTEAQAVIPRLPTMFDEPFADSSQIPTFIVSQFAREQVTVAISGDAGDELFGGYDRFRVATALWRHFSAVPEPLRRSAGAALSVIPASVWSNLAQALGRRRVGSKIRRLVDRMRTARTMDDLYASFFDEWTGETSPVLGATGRSDFAPPSLGVPGAPPAVQLMYIDAMTYLPDDVLCKVDRAAMATSLETRAPFLDHRVAALAARLPLDMKIRGSETKRILRQLLYNEAPRELFERPKAGFGVPVGDWLRGPLRDWAEALLDERRLREDGYLDPAIVRRRWNAHLSGERDDVPGIWALLMFQAWKESFGRGLQV